MTIRSRLTDRYRRGSPDSASAVRTQLPRRVQQAGLLSRRPGYYTAKVSLTLLGFIAGWAAFVLVGSSWWTLAVAAFLALAYTQVAFLGHDAGHKQIFASRRANYRLGLLLGNLGIGMSYGWWIDKHPPPHPNPTHGD